MSSIQIELMADCFFSIAGNLLESWAACHGADSPAVDVATPVSGHMPIAVIHCVSG